MTKPTCQTRGCMREATCLGAYEGAVESTYACDGCCGHGNEDGHCEPVDTIQEREQRSELASLREQVRTLSAANETLRETTLEAAHSLKARADAAEADNSVLVDVLRSVEHVDSRNPSAGMRYCPACGECEAGHTEACMLGHALHGAFRPGTGYRAKVRAELLRELAKEHRQAAALAHSLDAFDEGARQEAYAHSLETQAAREEQE